MANERPNDDKLGELILYISAQSEDDPRYGATKLNKILFWSDFIAYGQTGKSITGQPYQRLKWGPAPRRLLPVRNALKDAEALAIQTRDYGGNKQERPIALRVADLSAFTGEEIALVQRTIKDLWDGNATEVSELSHRTSAWQLAHDGEDIPLESVFVDDRKLTESEIAHALTLAI